MIRTVVLFFVIALLAPHAPAGPLESNRDPRSASVTLASLTRSTDSPSSAQRKFVNEEYELTKISDGVYSFIAPESDSGVVQSNCTVIIGQDAALMVDTGQFPSLAKRMVADIKQFTDKPVRYVVNTHWHFDHVWGNGVVREAFPGVAIVSTEYTRQMIEEEGPKTIKNQPGVNTQQTQELRKWIADGKLPDGRSISDATAARLKREADTLEHINLEFPHTVHTPPTIGFQNEMTINLGKREVKLMWLGRANTGGDAIVWVPDVRLLMTGDTVVAPVPFAFGSYMNEWPAVLQKIIDMKPALIIPGHGPLMRDTSYLQLLKETIEALAAQVKQAVAQGKNLKEMQAEIKLDDFVKRLAAGDKVHESQIRGTFIQPGVDRAYQEATGKLKPEADE